MTEGTGRGRGTKGYDEEKPFSGSVLYIIPFVLVRQPAVEAKVVLRRLCCQAGVKVEDRPGNNLAVFTGQRLAQGAEGRKATPPV